MKYITLSGVHIRSRTSNWRNYASDSRVSGLVRLGLGFRLRSHLGLGLGLTLGLEIGLADV